MSWLKALQGCSMGCFSFKVIQRKKGQMFLFISSDSVSVQGTLLAQEIAILLSCMLHFCYFSSLSPQREPDNRGQRFSAELQANTLVTREAAGYSRNRRDAFIVPVGNLAL